MSEYNICAQYREGRRALNALSYAGDLATRLRAPALHIYLPRPAISCSIPAMAGKDARSVQAQRIVERVRAFFEKEIIVHDDVDLEVASREQLPANAIVVSPDLASRRPDLNVLKPFEEAQVIRGGGAVLVPFGDGDSGVLSAAVAVPLAAKLGLDLVFYHTTWASPDIASKDPVDHICGEAKRHYDELGAMAKAAGVAYRMEIDMAEDVTIGMVRCAENGNISGIDPKPASLIVMTQGVNTCLGSYVEKALIKASTPMLVLSSKTRGGA